MLKEEIENKVLEDYRKIFSDNNIKEGLVYNVDIEVKANNNGMVIPITAKAIAIGIGKFKFALYPHIECKLVDENMRELFDVVFIDEDNCGEPVMEYSKENISERSIFPLKNFEDFIKDIKFGKIKGELYLEEKKRIEEALEGISKLIEENGIKED